MAYGIPEFPSGNMYDTDLTELLRLYRKLVEEYDDFVNRLSKLETDLKYLNEHIDEVIEERLIDVRNELAKLRADMERIQNDLIREVNDALRQIQELRTDVINRINTLEREVERQISDTRNYVNNEIRELRISVNSEINQLKQDVTQELENSESIIRTYVENEIRKFDGRILKINQDIVELKKYSDLKDNEVKKLVYDEIRRLEEKISEITVDQVWVKSPIDGQTMNIQQMIDEIWNHVDWWSLTAEEYDSLGLTAEQYDNWNTLQLGKLDIGIMAQLYDSWGLEARVYDSWELTAQGYDNMGSYKRDTKGLTAEEYDFLGKWYLSEKGFLVRYIQEIANAVEELCKKCKNEVECKLAKYEKRLVERTTVFSPFTGKLDEIKKVVMQMYGFLSYGALTAKEYDDLDLTAQEYDDKELTAYEYDWYGIKNLAPGGIGAGITAEQYDNLGIMPDGHVVSLVY